MGTSWNIHEWVKCVPCIVLILKSTNLNKCHYPVCFYRSEKWSSNHILFKGTQLEGADPAINVDKFALKAEFQPLSWGLLSLDPHSRFPLTGFLFWGLLHQTFQSRSHPRCTQILHTNICAEIIPFHLPALSAQSLLHLGTAQTGLLDDTVQDIA